MNDDEPHKIPIIERERDTDNTVTVTVSVSEGSVTDRKEGRDRQ